VLSLLSTTLLGADDQSIKDRLKGFEAAWNKHDSKAMAAIWADDEDVMNPFGVSARGRGDVDKMFANEHAGVFKASTYTISEVTVRSIAADVAVAGVTATISGVQGPDGAAAPDFPHHVTLVFVKKDGNWMVASARAFQFRGKPGETK
jgi:uncharacterized protein (TIGR02246 family)